MSLPAKYAKLGFRRGWAAYNKSKKRKRKTRKVFNMPRRKRFKKGYSRKSGVTFGSVTKVLIGAGIAALYEVFVSPMIPISGMVKNLVELALGLVLAAMPRSPMPVRAFGAALATINAYALIVSYIPTGSSSGENF